MYKLLNKIRDIKSLQIFTVYLRYLIGGAFVISTFTMKKFGQYGDINKLTNKIPINELPPAGVLFRVLAESGTYWHFIGISQLISGVLLMTQRFSRLGAIFYFIIILNIFIITIAFDFQGTPVRDFYFKPSIQIRELYTQIVNQAGYNIQSDFFDTAYFRRYY
jgi:uncharacterized membrane protein YphA (DoxX/SURF4 family)